MFCWLRHQGEWTSDGTTQPAPAHRTALGPMVKARLEPHQGSTHLSDIVNAKSVLARPYNEAG